MAIFYIDNPLVFTFGILGNLVSCMVYLAPVRTFYRVYKKKSTEEFHSLPYVVALFSSMLWIYYALAKSNEILLITVNCFGCITETIYVAIYIAYAPKKARIMTLKLLIFLAIGAYGLILSLTYFFLKGSKRVQVLGWINVTFSASVFIAPLSIMKQVIQSKSVEFMPFSLSFALVLSAIMWFIYGLLLMDFYVMVPNVVGLVFGVLQIALYMIYKSSKKDEAEQKLQAIVKPKVIVPSEVHPAVSLTIPDGNAEVEKEKSEGKVEPRTQCTDAPAEV